MVRFRFCGFAFGASGILRRHYRSQLDCGGSLVEVPATRIDYMYLIHESKIGKYAINSRKGAPGTYHELILLTSC